MKKTTLAVLLPLAAGLALAGTGFGAWVFSENVSAASAGDSIKVTPAVSLKDLTVVMDDDEITLDQGHDADMHIAFHFEVGNNITKGLLKEVEETAADTTDVTYKADATTDLDTTKTYTITYGFKYNVALSGGAATYLADPDGDDGHSVTGAQMTLTYDNDTTKWVLSAPDMTNTKEETFAWKTGTTTHVKDGTHTAHTGTTEKPETLTEYNAMITALKSTDTKIVLNLTDFAATEITCA